MHTDGSFLFEPNTDFTGTVEFTYVADDGQRTSEPTTAVITVQPVNDPPSVQVLPESQAVQYSDLIEPIVVIAEDPDSDVLDISVAGLGSTLTVVSAICSKSDDGTVCFWELDAEGAVTEAAGTYSATVTADDGTDTTDVDVTIVVGPEDAAVSFDDDNALAVRVDEDGGTGSVALSTVVREATPDLPDGAAEPGDIANAQVTMTLVPVGPGPTVTGTCTPGAVTGTGYDAALPVTCTFDDVPVNTYTVSVEVDGGYYEGSGEDVVTVYDPSLGFTTGGGWFYWPGSADSETGYPGDRTNFGYTMKYNRKGTNVKGSLLMIRHLPDGTKYRIKSNALDGLALGQDSSVPMGWATFSGKATYLDPTMTDPIGNHKFLVYVEDLNQPGTGIDRFWIQVSDNDGDTITESSFDPTPIAIATAIEGGNIFAPHTQATSPTTGKAGRR